MHAEVGVKTFAWVLWSLVDIDDLPSLISTIVLLEYLDALSFLILSTDNIEGESSVVDDVLTNKSEHLPPLLCFISNHNLGSGTVSIDVEYVIWVLS
jgi:hypothetical protein